MAYGDRRQERVDFERGIHVYIMGIDGTCEGLDLKEFFLLLSSTGLAFRRCQMVRVAGDQIGIRFLERDKPKKAPPQRQPTDVAV
jgi:hypothetical protein